MELRAPDARDNESVPRSGSDPRRRRLTYRFTTGSAATAEHTHALYLSLTVASFPRSDEARRLLVRATSPFLIRQWRAMGLPNGDLYHLVDRPGAVLDRPPDDTLDLEWVSVVLANTPIDGRLLVSRVPVTAFEASPRTNGRTTPRWS